MSTSKQHAQAERARAIAEALQASGARSLMELLAESERHKEHLDRLCAKLEALPKIVKKRCGSDAPAKRRQTRARLTRLDSTSSRHEAYREALNLYQCPYGRRVAYHRKPCRRRLKEPTVGIWNVGWEN